MAYYYPAFYDLHMAALDHPLDGLIVTGKNLIHFGETSELRVAPNSGCNQAARLDYAWILGDGTSDTGDSVTHQYAAPGYYTATVSAPTETGVLSSTIRILVASHQIFLPVVLGNNQVAGN